MEDSTWEGAIESAGGGAVEETAPLAPTDAPPAASTVEATAEEAAPLAAPEPSADTTKPTEETVQVPDRSDEEESPAKAAADPARSVRIMDEYLDPGAPIGTVTERLYHKSPARFEALARDILTTYKQHFLQEIFGLPEQEIRAKLEAQPAKVVTAPSADDQPSDYNPLEDPYLDESIKARLRNEEQLRGKLARFDDLEKKVTTVEEREKQREENDRAGQVQAIKTELLSSVTKVVDEEIKEYGLEVQEKDPSEIKTLKRTIAARLRREMPAAFDSIEANKKAADRALAHAHNLERDNAFREEDVMSVGTRNAMRSLKDSEEIKDLFRTLESLSNKRAARINERGKGAPPIPGSTGAGSAVSQAPLAGASIHDMWDQAAGEAAQSR